MLHIYDGYFLLRPSHTNTFRHIEPNLLESWVHFGRKPKRKRVCGSLNRTCQNKK